MPFYKQPNGNKFVFHSHIPKTGGTSIMGVFQDSQWEVSGYSGYGNPCSLQHRQLELESLQLDLVRNAPYRKFAVVREVEQRLVSAYCWQMMILGSEPSQDGFNWWLYSAKSALKSDAYSFDNHLRPQHEFVDDSFDLFAFGDWQGVSNYLAEIIGLHSVDLPHKHRLMKPDYFIEDSSNKTWVRDLYKKDYELFEKVSAKKRSYA